MESGGLKSFVELSVSCRNLKDLDVLSKSDPMCVIYNQTGTAWNEIKRTEVIQNDLNPNFATKVNLTYKFEEQQKLLFEVYDVDSHSANLKDHDFIGFCECTLGQIVSAGFYETSLMSRDGKRSENGKIIIFAEELESSKEEITIQLCGMNIPSSCWFFKPSTFLEFYKTSEAAPNILVYRSEVQKKSSNPRYNPIIKSVRSLSNCDYDRCLNVKCYHYYSGGGHKVIGEFNVTIRQLCDNNEKIFEIHNPKKPAKCMGTVQVISCKLEKVPTFLDYLKGGTNLQCTIGIDFTASNGDPTAPNSLHYQGNPLGSQYSQAILAVGSIIQDYDSDKMFPVLGFGARIPPMYNVSHEFFVNGKPDDPYCYGVQGILDAYKTCIPRVQLYGPTNFAPIVRHVIKFARSVGNGDVYFILLILTDGVITDMPQTKQAIIEAAEHPISIIIVGVGNADFGAMEELDGDVVPISYQNKVVSRDIVQFVPFNKFKGLPGQVNIQLAQEVLREIPDQFLSYMKKKNILPHPPKRSSQNLPDVPEQF